MLPEQMFIRTNPTTNVGFSRHPSYPGLFFKGGQSPMDDRLVSTLRKLFSHEKL
jgi:hypothetical protein